jgi:hypothetical protein
VEGVDARRAQGGDVIQAQTAADQEAGLVAGFATACRLGHQRLQPLVHTRRGAGREICVEARQVRELLAQGVAVRGPVDGPVERPPASVQHRHQALHRDQVRIAHLVQEAEHELVRALAPQFHGRPHEGVHVRRGARGEAVGQTQHDPQGDVDGLADPRVRLRRRGQPVRGDVGDQLQPVGPSGTGCDRVLGVEGDHLEQCSVAHGACSSR